MVGGKALPGYAECPTSADCWSYSDSRHSYRRISGGPTALIPTEVDNGTDPKLSLLALSLALVGSLVRTSDSQKELRLTKIVTPTHVHARPEMVLLAPSVAEIPECIGAVRADSGQHESLLAGLQRLRGTVYLEDGDIKPEQLTADGRHHQDVDTRSWHILLMGDRGAVAGCARFSPHLEPVCYRNLNAARSELAKTDGYRLEKAVEAHIRQAVIRNLHYVEVGGWALTPELRCSTAAVTIALTAFALAEFLGGCLGITTATRNHGSASILRRLGGRPLECEGVELPSYFDPQYNCEMEILRFDSTIRNARYAPRIAEIQAGLARTQVICHHQNRQSRAGYFVAA